MSQKCPNWPDIIWDMCYSMLIVSGLLHRKFDCTHPIPVLFEIRCVCGSCSLLGYSKADISQFFG